MKSGELEQEWAEKTNGESGKLNTKTSLNRSLEFIRDSEI